MINEIRCRLGKHHESDKNGLQRSEYMNQEPDSGFRAWARHNPGIISEMLISKRNS
jgi:hypothetical protein